MARIRNARDGSEFDCAEGDTILRAALRAGIGMPYSCNTGSCGNCRFDLVEGAVRHLRDDPPAWSERDLKRGRWLGCQAAPEGGGCTVKFRAMDNYRPPVTPARRRAVLTSATPVTRDISEFAFRIEGAPDFRPGQYALFHFPGIDGPRAYSFSNLAADGDWRFMVKRAPGGAGSGWLFDAAPGATLTLDGPFGNAWLREDIGRDLVLMAGGSGLSPMVSIARGAVAAGMTDRRIHLFYGCREAADLCGPEVLGEAAAHVGFTAALSEPGDGWTGASGFLHDVVADWIGAALPDHEIYFAGPAVMAGAIQTMAHGLNVPMDQLHFDEFY